MLLYSQKGAGLLGAGMAVAGACPGMVSAQLGGGVTNAGLVVAGGIAGALLYGLLDPILKPLAEKSPSLKGKTIDAMLSMDYSMVATGLGVFATAAAVGLEIGIPWQEEMKNAPGYKANKSTSNPFEMARW